MKYGVIVTTVFNSDIFQECLLTLKNSFNGRIVVVEEGNTNETVCKEFVEALGMDYLKSYTWRGQDPLIQMGIEHLDDCDIIIHTHNDVIFPPDWFQGVEEAWEVAYPTNKIGMLNCSFLQPHSNHALLVEDKMFDFCVDIHQSHRVGRCSVVMSFRRDVFMSFGIKLDIGTHYDTEMCWNFSKNGYWGCWIRNEPMVHTSDHKYGGNDTTIAVHNRTVNTIFQNFLRQQANWMAKYHFDLDYCLEYECLNIKYNNWTDIIDHINALDFEPIAHYLDDIRIEMLERWPIHRTIMKQD